MLSIMSGTTTEFNSLIFSIPDTTIMPPATAIISPSIGMPLRERSTYSPPASIEQSDMPAERNMQKPISLFLGITECLPAIRNRAQSSDINTEETATLSGEQSPKNNAISLPEENPAPIAVPIYRKVIFNAFFIYKKYAVLLTIMS